jgi:trans-2,3-dihydro-3-hydroxyanthranilate isomerase
VSSRFYIVDVFAERRYAGNQLAVVVGCGGMDEERMGEIAREFNFSETSFVAQDSPVDGSFSLRIFTPRGEVPFAGHPVIGASYVMAREAREGRARSLTVHLREGPVEVGVGWEGMEPGVLWMRQPRGSVAGELKRADVARVLGLGEGDIARGLPVEDAGVGFPFIIVPLVSTASLAAARVDVEAAEALTAATRAKAFLLFAKGARSNHLSMRVFAHHYGIPEDPATGSAAGALGEYLIRHALADPRTLELRIEQGGEVGRPSLIRLRARVSSGSTVLYVGGRVFMVARGELL